MFLKNKFPQVTLTEDVLIYQMHFLLAFQVHVNRPNSKDFAYTY